MLTVKDALITTGTLVGGKLIDKFTEGIVDEKIEGMIGISGIGKIIKGAAVLGAGLYLSKRGTRYSSALALVGCEILAEGINRAISGVVGNKTVVSKPVKGVVTPAPTPVITPKKEEVSLSFI